MMSSLRTRPCEDAIIQSTSAAIPPVASAKRWVLVATILASSIANIDESVINVALPAIETDLATSIVTIQWLVNAYTLMSFGSALGWRRLGGSVWPSAFFHHRG